MTARARTTQPTERVQVCEERVDTRRLARLLATIIEDQEAQAVDCRQPRREHR